MNALANTHPSQSSARPLTKNERIAALTSRLNALQSLYTQTASTFDQVEKQLTDSFTTYKNGTQLVDAVGQIALIWVSLGGLVRGAMQASSLEGEALVQANRQLGRDALQFAYQPATDVLMQTWASNIGAGDGHIWAFGKVVVKSFYDLTTPSFWAGVATNLGNGKSWSDAVNDSPEATVQAALERIESQRLQALHQIKARMFETQKQLALARNG